ncbi:MAG: polysaccharide export outer membrane protein [Yoonia sp.]
MLSCCAEPAARLTTFEAQTLFLKAFTQDLDPHRAVQSRLDGDHCRDHKATPKQKSRLSYSLWVTPPAFLETHVLNKGKEFIMHYLKTLLLGLTISFLATVATAQNDYLISSGDTLQIEVFEDSDLNRSVVVLSDGRISFPFAGTLRVSGRSIGEVQASITSAIASNFAAPPTVFVSVQPAPVIPGAADAPAPPPTIEIYFLGEVSNPGIKSVAPGTTFLQAMAQAGELTNFAALKRVQLRRTDRTGQPHVFTINYRAILNGATMRNNVVLEPGDVIIVPERRLFE